MVAAYDCGIETNVQAWHAVHEGFRDGLTRMEISGRTGISYQMIGVYRRRLHPASIVRRINRNHGGAEYCACGAPRSNSMNRAGRCQRCEHRRARREAGIDGHIEMLRSWALRHGRVPTINESAELLSLSRGRAGDIVVEAFGLDERAGAQRRLSYRGWPDGAPDVPRPDQAARLRDQAAHARLAR